MSPANRVQRTKGILISSGLLFTAIAACSGLAVSDSGFACFFQDEQAALTNTRTDLQADSSLTVLVRFDECFHPTSRTREATCTVTREGDGLAIAASAIVTRGNQMACTPAYCREVTVVCETGPLDPGVYSVRYGERSLQLTLPHTGAIPCV